MSPDFKSSLAEGWDFERVAGGIRFAIESYDHPDVFLSDEDIQKMARIQTEARRQDGYPESWDS